MVTVPISLFVELQETDGIVAALTESTAVLWGLALTALFGLCWAVTAIRANAWRYGNGSFFYISALVHPRYDTADRDIARWKAAVRFGENDRPFSLLDVIEGGMTPDELKATDPPLSIDKAIQPTIRDIEIAIRPDDPKTPTNLLFNSAWPLGIALGANIRQLNHEKVRIWYLRDNPDQPTPTWLGRYQVKSPWQPRPPLAPSFLERELLDVVDLSDLAEFHDLSAEVDRQCEKTNDEIGLPTAVVLELTDEFDRLDDYLKQLGVGTVWTVTPSISPGKPTKSYDPASFAIDAAVCAKVISEAIRDGSEVHLFARVPIPLQTAIGYALVTELQESAHDADSEITLHNWAIGQFEAWHLSLPAKKSVVR